mgnify:CR=1 FL=1
MDCYGQEPFYVCAVPLFIHPLELEWHTTESVTKYTALTSAAVASAVALTSAVALERCVIVWVRCLHKHDVLQ